MSTRGSISSSTGHGNLVLAPIKGTVERAAPPPHRHAAPSSPWPWLDLSEDLPTVVVGKMDPRTARCTHHLPSTKSPPESSKSQTNLMVAPTAARQRSSSPKPSSLDPSPCACWTNYPTPTFRNWKESQLERSGLKEMLERQATSQIHSLEVNEWGVIWQPNTFVGKISSGADDANWNEIRSEPSKRPSKSKVRIFFVENMSGPLLQMLGARYHIEPFFFSSAAKGIPTRYQEDINLTPTTERAAGDHITIVLPFIKKKLRDEPLPEQFLQATTESKKSENPIQTEGPLRIQNGTHMLVQDHISLHFIRDGPTHTLISCESKKPHGLSAKDFHSRMAYVGLSDYWSGVFNNAKDPTLVLLCFLWYPIHSWDEALEELFKRIMQLEQQWQTHTLTQEMNVIRAYLLHYGSLLDAFARTVEFIKDTPNPGMALFQASDSAPGSSAFSQPLGASTSAMYGSRSSSPSPNMAMKPNPTLKTIPELTEALIDTSRRLLERECKSLSNEVERLKALLDHQARRLDNLAELITTKVNVDDSKQMKELTFVTVKDSAAMKLIAYLTLFFLPATFVAGLFGMNITILSDDGKGKLTSFLALAIPLSAFTIWLALSFHGPYILEGNYPIWRRAVWFADPKFYKALLDRPANHFSNKTKVNDPNQLANGHTV